MFTMNKLKQLILKFNIFGQNSCYVQEKFLSFHTLVIGIIYNLKLFFFKQMRYILFYNRNHQNKFK